MAPATQKSKRDHVAIDFAQAHNPKQSIFLAKEVMSSRLFRTLPLAAQVIYAYSRWGDRFGHDPVEVELSSSLFLDSMSRRTFYGSLRMLVQRSFLDRVRRTSRGVVVRRSDRWRPLEAAQIIPDEEAKKTADDEQYDEMTGEYTW